MHQWKRSCHEVKFDFAIWCLWQESICIVSVDVWLTRCIYAFFHVMCLPGTLSLLWMALQKNSGHKSARKTNYHTPTLTIILFLLLLANQRPQASDVAQKYMTVSYAILSAIMYTYHAGYAFIMPRYNSSGHFVINIYNLNSSGNPSEISNEFGVW